jgi:protein-S-isoprenylcysteine O-methyltransferase Ste14
MVFSEFVEKNRVKFSVLITMIIIIISRPNYWSIAGGFLVSILGNLLRLWSSGYIKKEKVLASTGPYSLTRNPLYLGNFIIGAGFCLASWQILSIPIFILFFLLFYIPLIKNEERRMEEIFKEEYLDYKKKVPVFFPNLKKFPKKDGFSIKNVIENKEWRGIISTLLFYFALSLKVILFK